MNSDYLYYEWMAEFFPDIKLELVIGEKVV